MNYRLLNLQEIKQKGDERYLQISLGGHHKWTVIDPKEVGQVFGREWDDSPVRRDMNNKTVPCVYCRSKTVNLGTKMCNKCWELEHSIESNPELAAQIILTMPDHKVKQIVQAAYMEDQDDSI